MHIPSLEAAPLSTFMFAGEDHGAARKECSVKDIAAAWAAEVAANGGAARRRTQRTMQVDGHTVLKANAYTLEEGEPSVFARESVGLQGGGRAPQLALIG